MSSLTRHGRLKFNTSDIDGTCSDNIGVFLRDGYGSQLTSTDVDAYQALDVYIRGPVNDDGYVMVSIQDADINLDVDISQYAEDTAHVTGDLGDFNLSIRLDDLTADNSANLAGTDGDYQGFFTNEKGELYVHDEDAYGKLCEIVTGLDDINFDPSITNEDGYLFVDISGTPLQVDTITEMEIMDCPLVDGYTGLQSFTGDSHRRLWVNNSSAIAGSVSAVDVDETASLLLSGGALGGRTRILLQNKGEEIVYIGFDSGVTADDTATGGFELDCGDVLALEISECISLYAITPTATGAKVKVIETA